jgi:long-chain acyl-CoA synthetase
VQVNVADLVRDAADGYPAKAALVFRGRSISFSGLEQRVDLTASALAAHGVGKGDRVALLAGNVPEFVTTLYGALRAGAVACPLNVMLTPEEIGYILADAGAKVVVTELATLPGLLAVRDRLADLEVVFVIGGPPAPARTISLEEALTAEGVPLDVSTEESDPAVIAYTAGTTAEPKGAMLTHGNLLANLEQIGAVSALSEATDDVVLLALPLFHIYALNVILGLCLRNGTTAVLVERFDPRETLDLVMRHGVTVLFGAPPMFSAWLELARSGTTPDLSGVRLSVSGAAPLPPETLLEFRERFGLTIWEGYGLTEAGPAVTTNALGTEARPGSIGLPLPGLEVKLVDERGDPVEEGDPGEILVRGPNVFAGYWARPDATMDVFDGDWLRTGDVAYRDEDGYLFLVDRKKDLINVSGFNVYPKEVEEAIGLHPGVAEAAVVGIPDERTGEAVQAWVVPQAGRGVTEEAILDHLHGYLARFKWPKEILIVSELPHHVTGKVLRRVLRNEETLRDPEGSSQ